MTIQQIDKLAARRDQLTERQKRALASAIKRNPQARPIAARGAFLSGNLGLFAHLDEQLVRLGWQKADEEVEEVSRQERINAPATFEEQALKRVK